MRDRQKPTITAEDRYRAAWARFEEAVRDGRTREELRPMFRDVNDALDDWKGPLEASG